MQLHMLVLHPILVLVKMRRFLRRLTKHGSICSLVEDLRNLTELGLTQHKTVVRVGHQACDKRVIAMSLLQIRLLQVAGGAT
jgi:hypothetical protein